MNKKYKFANRWNCSNKFLGRNVNKVYFVVLETQISNTRWPEIYTNLSTKCIISNSILIYTTVTPKKWFQIIKYLVILYMGLVAWKIEFIHQASCYLELFVPYEIIGKCGIRVLVLRHIRRYHMIWHNYPYCFITFSVCILIKGACEILWSMTISFQSVYDCIFFCTIFWFATTNK